MAVTITGAKAIEDRLTRASKNLFGDLEKAMVKVGKLLEKTIKWNVNNRLLKVRSGRLLGSIEHDVFTPGKTVRLEVTSDTPYSRIQDKGGRTGRGGATVIRPTFYMSKTIKDKEKQINAIMSRAIKKALK